MEGGEPPDHTALFRAAQVWAWIICVLGSSGNLLTLATGAHQLCLAKCSGGSHRSLERSGWRRRAPPAITLQADTLLLLHLSLCDLLYCSVNLPIIAINYDFALSNTPTSIYPSDHFCKVTVVFRYLNAFIEWMTLALLPVERCLDMGRVRSDRIFTPVKTGIILACCWVVALLLQVYSIIYDDYGFDNTTFKCDMNDETNGKKVFYILETPLPCILAITGGTSIIYQVWSNKKRLIAAQMPPDLVERRSRSTWRSTALVLCLLTLFLLCVIPNAVYNIVIASGAANDVPIALATFMIYWMQYGVNFILYAAGNRNFRQAYIQFFKAVAEVLLMRQRSSSPSQPENPAARSGSVSFLTIPAVEVEDMSEKSPMTPEFCKEAWNTSSGELMSNFTVGGLKPYSSSSSSISWSTTSISSSSSWDSSSTLATCVSLSSSR